MSNGSPRKYAALGWLPILIVAWPTIGSAQTPVDEDGNPVGEIDATVEMPLLSSAELQELVGPIALYPDDLLAIVLPSSTYPLQLVQAQRFLDDLDNDASLQPNDSWDDSIIALINYPEAVELLNDDLDWTWRLGEAVVAQQADVIKAIESFRDRAYAAGNLKSDEYQTISEDNGVIEITPVSDDVIYVPYYEPERVVTYQSRQAYYYHPDPYPVYYYPYPAGYAFHHGLFWGVTTAFTIGWYSDNLHVYHHSYFGHPYYGHSYRNHHWYRRPDIHVHNYHYNHHSNYSHSNHYQGHGDYWQPHSGSTFRSADHRVTRSRHYPGRGPEARPDHSRPTDSARSDVKFRTRATTHPARPRTNEQRPSQSRSHATGNKRADITFRDRPTIATARNNLVQPSNSQSSHGRSSQGRADRSRSNSGSSGQARVSQSRSSHSGSGQSSRPSQSRPSHSGSGQSRPSQSRESHSRPSRSRESHSGDSGSRKVASASHDKGSKGSRGSRRH